MAGVRATCCSATRRACLQGPETSRLSTMTIARALRRSEPGLGVPDQLSPRRHDYLCALEIHPVFSRTGVLEYFVAFEREVVRRRGRPRNGFAGRYMAVDPEALLPGELGFRRAA